MLLPLRLVTDFVVVVFFYFVTVYRSIETYMGYQRHFEYELFTSSMVQIYTNQMKLKSVKTNEKTKKKKKSHTKHCRRINTIKKKEPKCQRRARTKNLSRKTTMNVPQRVYRSSVCMYAENELLQQYLIFFFFSFFLFFTLAFNFLSFG